MYLAVLIFTSQQLLEAPKGENILTFKRHLKTHLFKHTQSSCAASSVSVSSDLKALYKSVIIIMNIIISSSKLLLVEQCSTTLMTCVCVIVSSVFTALNKAWCVDHFACSICDRNEANSPRHVVGCHLANNSIKSPTDHAIRKCAFSCAFSPNCWGTGGG